MRSPGDTEHDHGSIWYDKSYDLRTELMPVSNHHIRLDRSLATSEARKALPQLVNELVEVAKPGATLTAHAVEIGPRNRGGVWMLPAIDAEAAIEREGKLRKQLEEYEAILEDMALGQIIEERLSKPSSGKISGIDFIRELGFSEIADSIDASP